MKNQIGQKINNKNLVKSNKINNIGQIPSNTSSESSLISISLKNKPIKNLKVNLTQTMINKTETKNSKK